MKAQRTPDLIAYPAEILCRPTGRVVLIGLALLFGAIAMTSPATGAEPPAPPIESSRSTAEAFLAKCTKILTYGDSIGGSRPTKTDAVIALGVAGDERAIPVLVDHLENETNQNLRLQIVRALSWIGGEKTVSPLEQALRDSYPYVRYQAALALKAITGREYEYDKTGLPDRAKLLESIRTATQPSQ